MDVAIERVLLRVDLAPLGFDGTMVVTHNVGIIGLSVSF
jgi:hypothetical protein